MKFITVCSFRSPLRVLCTDGLCWRISVFLQYGNYIWAPVIATLVWLGGLLGLLLW
jgi:hypothetical protein